MLALAVLALTAPTGNAVLQEAPSLEVTAVQEGNLLAWEHADDAPRPTAVEVWRADLGDTSYAWDRLATVDGTGKTFLDDGPSASNAFYVIRALYEDGSASMPSQPNAADYPHCDWIYLQPPNVPQVRPLCLLPPPWPASIVWEKAEPILDG